VQWGPVVPFLPLGKPLPPEKCKIHPEQNLNSSPSTPSHGSTVASLPPPPACASSSAGSFQFQTCLVHCIPTMDAGFACCLEQHAPRITNQGPSDSGLLEAGCKASACIPQPHTQPSSSHPLPVVALVVGRHHQVPFNLSSARSPPVCPSSLRVARTLCRTPLTPGASLWLPVITYHDLDLIATTTVPRFGLADLLARAPRDVL
jgi:hypothetical protein